MIWLLLVLAQSSPDPNLVSRGEVVFAQSCATGYCHGSAGTAGRGPRLRGTGLSRDRILEATRDGIPRSAMPGWEGKLSETDLSAVVEYVWSLALDSREPPPDDEMPPGTGPAAYVGFEGPEEASQGRDLFFDATREARCATCHEAGGRGIPIGPDLLALGDGLRAKLVGKTRSRRSHHVLNAKLRDGQSFAALQVAQEEDRVQLYDLTTIPPVLRTLLSGDIESLARDEGWEHRTVAAEYSEGELGAIVHYLDWLNTRKPE